ncbi:hypothetical protein [Acidimangrovimonas pyrenivorans]|uniref:Glycosyl hydrolase catalytic core n=1 Tax=Acidimangrovimonas pyrenivorans TaxID=2030798 RepID=A0ABV7ACB9_9RHOB
MIRRYFLPLLLGAALPLAAAAPAAALDLRGPALAADSNFGQGWSPEMLAAAQGLGVRALRDAVYWSLVERDGEFHFDRKRTSYPDKVAAAGLRMSLVVNNGHPDYDDGKTPHSKRAVAAFARDAAETVKRFPVIDSVEVGNEFNSANFVDGPVKEGGLSQRVAYYAALLKATHDAVKAARPEVRILGGGVHSIPVGYLQRLFALGAAADMDALALHPYSTPPEQLARQIAVLRRLPQAAEMPIEVTEFGTTDAAAAPGFLLRNYCQMALSGVSRAVWFPLNARGDGLEPLVDDTGAATPTGRAYATAARLLEGKPVSDAAPDPFTYACQFGDRALVIWGAPRALHLGRSDLQAFDPSGAPLAPSLLQLSETDPILVTGESPFVLGTDVTLGPQRLIADSYDQYAFPGGRTEDGFDRYVLAGGKRVELEMRPGQEAPGRPWTPYLAAADNPWVRLQARSLLPGGSSDRPEMIVQSFTAPHAMTLRAEARFTPAQRSADGIEVTVALNDRVLFRGVGKDPQVFDGKPLTLKAGDTLSFTVGPNGNAKGDVTAYRITLRRAAPAEGTAAGTGSGPAD